MPRRVGRRVLPLEIQPYASRRRAALELMGARFTPVSPGVQGLASWAAEESRAELSDIAMPEMDGCEFIREIHRMEQAQGKPRTPTVAIQRFLKNPPPRRSIGFDRYMAGETYRPVELALLIDDLCRDRPPPTTAGAGPGN